MMPIELLDCGVEFLALLALNQQRGYLFTPLDVLWTHFSHFPFLGPPFTSRVSWTKCVGRETPLMVIKSSLGLGMPDLAFLVRKVLPSKTDDFRQSTVVCLYFRRHMLALNKRRSEKNEGVWGPRNMILGLLLAMSRTTTGRTIDKRREEN
jgi:hypothetical protein